MPDLSNLFHFLEDNEISVYLTQDKDIIASSNREDYPYCEIYIFLISKRKHVVGTH